MNRRIAALSLGVVGLLALAPTTQAAEGDVDVSAWLEANKETIEFFLDVDVDSCAGLDGITYEDSVRLADAEGIDLKELAKQTDPDKILEYVNDSGITLSDIDRFLTKFCERQNTPTAPGGATDTPSAFEPPAGAKTDKPSPSVSDEDLNGKMADTGGLSPWTPLGIGVGALALGSGGYYWARKAGKI